MVQGKGWVDLPPGWKFEPHHRLCPRCGLDLTQQMPEAEGDQRDAKQIEQDADQAGGAWIPGCVSAKDDACLQRMVAPLTEAEKERAQRNEQRWLDGQAGQQPATGEQENGEARGHQNFVPVVDGKFGKWMLHAWQFITRTKN